MGAFLGWTASRSFLIRPEVIAAFAELSGDRSPVHVDPAFARGRGFRDCLAHGALQAALVSCVIGMQLPGDRGVLQELSMKYRSPCYAGDTLGVTLTVKEVFPEVRVIRMDVRIVNQNGQVVSTGKAQSGIV